MSFLVLRRLRWTTTTMPARPSLHLRERRSLDAARRPTLEREALQVEHDHGDQGIPRTFASHACPAGLGGDRRSCAGVGREAQYAPVSIGQHGVWAALALGAVP